MLDDTKLVPSPQPTQGRGWLVAVIISMAVIAAVVGLLVLGAHNPGADESTRSVPTARFRGGDMACLSRDLYDQSSQAVLAHNQTAFSYLVGRGCLLTTAGTPVTILDGILVLHVRTYAANGAPTDMWVAAEGVQH